VNLTNNPAVDAFPAVSADGTKIAFESDRDGNTEIYTMNADGSGPVVRLTNNPDWDYEPEFSPDGTKIAFSVCATPPTLRATLRSTR
jgi:TolB protein